MPGYSQLAPIPIMHLRGAIEILQTKEFALFGSEAFDVLNDTEFGTKVLIYASHDEAEPIVSYVGTFAGIVGDPMEMRKLKKAGYRPATTDGEKWSFYWKIKKIIETCINSERYKGNSACFQNAVTSLSLRRCMEHSRLLA